MTAKTPRRVERAVDSRMVRMHPDSIYDEFTGYGVTVRRAPVLVDADVAALLVAAKAADGSVLVTEDFEPSGA